MSTLDVIWISTFKTGRDFNWSETIWLSMISMIMWSWWGWIKDANIFCCRYWDVEEKKQQKYFWLKNRFCIQIENRLNWIDFYLPSLQLSENFQIRTISYFSLHSFDIVLAFAKQWKFWNKHLSATKQFYWLILWTTWGQSIDNFISGHIHEVMMVEKHTGRQGG